MVGELESGEEHDAEAPRDGEPAQARPASGPCRRCGRWRESSTSISISVQATRPGRHHHPRRRRARRQEPRRGWAGRGAARDAARDGAAHGRGPCRSRARHRDRRRRHRGVAHGEDATIRLMRAIAAACKAEPVAQCLVQFRGRRAPAGRRASTSASPSTPKAG